MKKNPKKEKLKLSLNDFYGYCINIFNFDKKINERGTHPLNWINIAGEVLNEKFPEELRKEVFKFNKGKKFRYTVHPEFLCEGLEMWRTHKEASGETWNCWEGWLRYSKFYKEWYLTIDDVTYTSLRHAWIIEPIEEKIKITGEESVQQQSFCGEKNG